MSKRLQLVLSTRGRSLVHSITQLGFLQLDDASVHIIRYFSSSLKKISSEAEEHKQSFVVSYLKNSCGLSLESAIAASEKLHLKTPDKAESVLALLRNHGFSKTHISKLVSNHPGVLLANPEKTLLPKLQFFYSIGVSSADLPMILSKNPSILFYSLDKHLIPACNFLKSIVPDERVVATFRRYPRLFCYDVEKKLGPKVAYLRELGVPQSLISLFITCYSSAAKQSNEKFTESVDKVIKMGFHPSKCAFIAAIVALSVMTKSTWEHKMEVYRRWGWSEDEVWRAFKVQPICMNLSEKKIASTMDYFVNKMGCQSTTIARNPTIIFYNLEKRIIPRCSVIKALVLKGLLKKEPGLGSFLNPSEKHFLDRFVIKYQEEVPQLSNVYQGKMGLLELGFGLAEICGIKQL